VNGKIGVSTTSYGSSLPSTGTTGQVFYQLSDPYYELPAGGTTGQVLIKNSNSDRDVTWGEAGSSVPDGGTAGQALIKNSSTNGDASWGGPYLPLSGGTMTGDIYTNTAGVSINGINGTYTSLASQRYLNKAIEIREDGLVGSTKSDVGYAPGIGFHWSNRIAATLVMNASGELCYYK